MSVVHARPPRSPSSWTSPEARRVTSPTTRAARGPATVGEPLASPWGRPAEQDEGPAGQLGLRGGGTLDVRRRPVLRFLAQALLFGLAERVRRRRERPRSRSARRASSSRPTSARSLDRAPHVRLTDDGKLDAVRRDRRARPCSRARTRERSRCARSVGGISVTRHPTQVHPPWWAAAAPIVAGPRTERHRGRHRGGRRAESVESHARRSFPSSRGRGTSSPVRGLWCPAGARSSYVAAPSGPDRPLKPRTSSSAARRGPCSKPGARQVSVDGTPTSSSSPFPGGRSPCTAPSASAPASADVVLDDHETDVSLAPAHGAQGSRVGQDVTGERGRVGSRTAAPCEKSIAPSRTPRSRRFPGRPRHAPHHPRSEHRPRSSTARGGCGPPEPLPWRLVARRGRRFLPVGLADAPEEGTRGARGRPKLRRRQSRLSRPVPRPARSGLQRRGALRRDSGAVRCLARPVATRCTRTVAATVSSTRTCCLELTLDWPEAPAGEALTLKVREGKDRLDGIAVGTSSYTFSSGKLGDGTYGFWFEVQRNRVFNRSRRPSGSPSTTRRPRRRSTSRTTAFCRPTARWSSREWRSKECA